MTKRIALYWHNGRSLGHTVRSLALGQGLLEHLPDSTVIGITGASRYFELLPPGMDVLKIPSFLGYDEEGAVRNESILALTRKEFQLLRENLLATFLSDFRPHVFTVDFDPQGKRGELVPAFLKTPAIIKILGLRGILKSFEETNAEFFHPRMVSFIQEHYSAIHVYTDPRVFCLEEYYRTPPAINKLIKYTGYVVRPTVATKAEARAALGLDADARILVASFGGGQGAELIWEALIAGLAKIQRRFDYVYFAAGPYLEANSYERLRRMTGDKPGWYWSKLLTPFPTWLKACDLFIGAGGYNTLGEVISTSVNALIIPRQLNEQEQLMHAQRLAALKFLRIASLETITGGSMAPLLETCLAEPYPDESQGKVMMDGVRENARLIETMI
jgi:predicted glycosyltransferase